MPTSRAHVPPPICQRQLRLLREVSHRPRKYIIRLVIGREKMVFAEQMKRNNSLRSSQSIYDMKVLSDLELTVSHARRSEVCCQLA